MGRHTTGVVLDGPAPDPAPPEHSSIADKVRFVVRGVGQTLITFGLIVLLFVFYEVYVTNWFASEAQSKVKHELIKEWADAHSDPLAQLPNGSYPKLPAGRGIANLYIPRLGRDYEYTIVQATSTDDLTKGPGHYASTAMPGQLGNFAVAGHRVGKGEPFLNLDHLRPGDAVIVETESHFFVYRVKGDVAKNDLSVKGADGIPGREIVDPGDGSVLLPVPDHPGVTPTEHLMTMTTCHPKFTAQQRMIVYAALQSSDIYAKASGSSPMPAPIKALYNGVS